MIGLIFFTLYIIGVILAFGLIYLENELNTLVPYENAIFSWYYLYQKFKELI